MDINIGTYILAATGMIGAIIMMGYIYYTNTKKAEDMLIPPILVAILTISFALFMLFGAIGITGDLVHANHNIKCAENTHTDIVTIKDKWIDSEQYYFMDTNDYMYIMVKHYVERSYSDHINIPIIRFRNLQVGEQYKVTYCYNVISYFDESIKEESVVKNRTNNGNRRKGEK